MEKLSEKPALHEEREQDFINKVLLNNEFVCPYAAGVDQAIFAHAPAWDLDSPEPFAAAVTAAFQEFLDNPKKKHLVIFHDNQPVNHDHARLYASHLFVEMSAVSAVMSSNFIPLDHARKLFQVKFFEEIHDPSRSITDTYINLPNNKALFAFAMGPLFPYNKGHNPHPRHLGHHAIVCTDAEEINKVFLNHPDEVFLIRGDASLRMLHALNPGIKDKAGRHLIGELNVAENRFPLSPDLHPEIYAQMHIPPSVRSNIGLYPEEKWTTVIEPSENS